MSHAPIALGTDIVHIPTFRAQLELPGSTFIRAFHDRELRACATKPDRVASLAARWAAKEAYIKAWSATLYGKPPVIAPEHVDFPSIEVVQDVYGRPALTIHPQLHPEAPNVCSLSLSHDGNYAVATCIVECLR